MEAEMLLAWKMDPGYCMSCRSQLDLAPAFATVYRAATKINGYIMHYFMRHLMHVFICEFHRCWVAGVLVGVLIDGNWLCSVDPCGQQSVWLRFDRPPVALQGSRAVPYPRKLPPPCFRSFQPRRRLTSSGSHIDLA